MQRSFFGRLFSAAAIAAAAAALATLPAQAGPFSSMFVFGDSLSDSGNNASPPFNLYDPNQVITGNSYIPSFTYAPARTYSNGLVWASYFASAIGVPLTPSVQGGTNFAFGGATTGPANSPFPYSLLTQASTYLGAVGNVASASALYVVEGGGNNARAALTAVLGGANLVATANATASAFAADVGVIVDELQAAGAKHIVVWNTPNLGLTPAVTVGGPQAQFAGSFVAHAMNDALALRLAGEAGVTTFDVFGFGSAVAGNPGAFGFTNVADACGAVAGANCSQYFFWDGIHPTTAAHHLIADQLLVTLNVPEPETYVLLAFGLVVVALQGRRRANKVAASA